MTDELVRAKQVEALIRTVRGQKVILDTDLAKIYGVKTKALNQAVKRNADRFPEDFAFQLTAEEVSGLRSQIVALDDNGNRSQIVTGSQKHRDPRYLPYAFTEHGAIMAANVLSSPQAVRMSVFVVRAFVKMREHLSSRSEMEKRLMQIENILLAHDDGIRDLYQKICPLLLSPPDPPAKQIGFHVKETRSSYSANSEK